MDTDIEALIQAPGSAVTFSRSEQGNVLCVVKSGDKTWEEETKTVHDALVGALTKARVETNRNANPHLEP